MIRARSINHRGRRPLKGWQLTALVGVVGALGVAGCSSSCLDVRQHQHQQQHQFAGQRYVGSRRLGHVGLDRVVGEPHHVQSYGDTRTALITAFNKLYPNIHVNLVSAPTNTDTNRATLATEISGGSATPDVFMGDVIWPAQFGAHQLAVPLSNYLPASYWAQFAPGLVAGASYKGQVYGSPLFEDQGFMYYRKDLLAKEALSPPTTWEQLESEAKTLLQQAGLVKYGFVWQGASYEGLTCNFMEYLTSAGGTATNSDYTKATLDSPAAIKAVTFMRGLVTSGVTPAAISTFQEAQAMNTFADRRLRVPAELGLRLLRRHQSGRWRQAHGQSGRRGADAGVRRPADPRVLQHRRLEHVHQPAQQEHRRRPDVHQVPGQPDGADHPGGRATPRSPPPLVVRNAPHDRRAEPGARHRQQDQAGPAARRHA